MRTSFLATLLAIPFLALPLAAAGAPPAPAPAAPAVAKHAPTIDDVMRMHVIVGMEVSPTGHDAVIQVQDYDGGARFAKDLWRVVPGQAPARLTTGGRTGGSYAYSPDGTRIAFAGERNGKQGIHVLPLSGGESTTVLEAPVPVDNLRWVGGTLYFTAAVLPACAADFACTVKTLADRAQKTSAMVYTKLYVRPWDAWADGTHNALFAVPQDGGAVWQVAGGDFDVPPIPFGGREDYDVAPDGTVVYAAKQVPDPWHSTNTDLFLVANGTRTKLTDNPAADEAPVFSPDGQRIAYRAQATPGFESDQWRLRIYDRATGQSFALADNVPDWVSEIAWTPDGRGLVFTVEEQGREPLYAVDAKPGAVARRLTQGFTERRLALVPGDPRHAWVTREAIVQPPDAWRIDLRKPEAAERLTDLNRAALSALDLPRIEEVWWDGAESSPGVRPKVHAFLAIPAGTPPAHGWPLVLAIHGGPQGAWEDSFHPRWNPLGWVGQGFVIAMPNPTGSTGYGQAFVNGVSKDWGGRPFVDLMRGVDTLAMRPDVDGDKVCAIGGSYGGYMANWLEAQTDRFRCLVDHDGPSMPDTMYGTTDELWFPEWDVGGTPWDDPQAYRRFSPAEHVKQFKTPMLIIQGERDYRVPVEQALWMFTALQRRGVESKLVVFPDEDHFVLKPKNRKFWYDTVNAWLSAHLK